MDEQLREALQTRQYERANQLIMKGADVNWRPNRDARPTIFFPIYNGEFEIVKLLIRHGADINAESAHGTALRQAALDGRVDVIEHLLDCGADPDSKGSLGLTALSGAVKNNHYRVVKLLLKAGADVNHKSKHGYSVKHGIYNTKMLKLLERKHVVNVRKKIGMRHMLLVLCNLFQRNGTELVFCKQLVQETSWIYELIWRMSRLSNGIMGSILCFI